MTHAVHSRAGNLIGAFALVLVDSMSDAIYGQGGPTGSAAAALLLVHHGHVRRVDDLRAPLALSQAGVVRLIDRLVGAGLVQRVAGDAGDRRQVAVALTAKGETRATELLQARERAITGLLDGLTPNQIADMGRACERVLAVIAAAHAAPARICRYCDETTCDLTRCPVELARTQEVPR
jgi:DNA-binding MarR family transcriptional regulator